ncbi:hypothetical protein [Herbiconiux sp. UC225_62]|uniref:hypothetical protein n=1 Tax=Herbiconiux sp. UC225_62 TaxID=3350168 RepID=UPI0036D2E8C8
MKVTAMVRNTETREVRDIETEAPNYDTGYAQLQARIPDGWKMIAVSAERD